MGKYLPIFEKVLFGLFLSLLVFIPLFPKIPAFDVPGTFINVRWEDFLIAFVLGLWGIYILISKNLINFFKDRLNQTLLLFFFIGAVSMFVGVVLSQTVVPVNVGILHYLRRIELMMLLPFTLTVIKSRNQLILSLAVLSVVTLAVGYYGLGQIFFKYPVIATTTNELSDGEVTHVDGWTRINSTFAGHYDLAIFTVMVLSALTALFFGVKNYFVKGWITVLGALSFVVLVLTAARQSFVAALVGIIASLLIVKQKKYILVLFLIALAALAYPSQLRDRMISTVTVSILNQGEKYHGDVKEQIERQGLNIPTLPGEVSYKVVEATRSARIATGSAEATEDIAPDIVPGEPTNTTDLGIYRSLSIRLDVEWPRALRALNKNPLLGTGYGSIGEATDNDYLRSLGEVGILGTLAFALILVEISKRVWKNFRSKDRLIKYFSAGVLSMMVAFLVNGTFIDVFEASKVASLFWMVAGVNIAAAKLK